MSDLWKHAGQHLAHEAMKQAGVGCMVTLLLGVAGIGALSAVIVAIFA